MIDRRISPRLPAVKNVATADSVARPGRPFRCRIIEISRSGALVECDSAITPDERLRIRLESPTRTTWTPVRVARSEAGKFALEFDGDCPNPLYIGTSFGIGMGPSARTSPSSFLTSCVTGGAERLTPSRPSPPRPADLACPPKPARVALRISTFDRVAAIRIASDMRRLGGLPSRSERRIYEFADGGKLDRALDVLRRSYGWTSVEVR